MWISIFYVINTDFCAFYKTNFCCINGLKQKIQFFVFLKYSCDSEFSAHKVFCKKQSQKTHFFSRTKYPPLLLFFDFFTFYKKVIFFIWLGETKISIFTNCRFPTSDNVFALYNTGRLRVKVATFWPNNIFCFF